MDSEKIVQELNQRFAAPLPEFYKRRIVFWYDEDKEFEDKLEENKKEIETNLQKEISLSITTASPFKIILNESDNPLFDKNDVFYIKKSEGDTNPPQKKENKKNNHLSLNKNFFSLTPEQVQLDKEITESIQKGETFKSIKSKFKGLLVEKQ